MAVIVNGDGILTGISSLATALTDLTSGRGTVTGVATVGTLQLGTGVSMSSPRSQNAAIFTNNTEFLTVDDAGRVGVGTVTPNTDAHPQNVGKINVGFVTARSIAGDIDANTMVVAGISTFVGALNATSVVSSGAVSGTTGTFSGDVSIARDIIHTGDTDTYMRFDTDTIKFDTGGVTRFTLTGGNVIQQSGTFIVKNAVSDSTGLKISQESSNESRIFNHYSGPITFGIANTEKLRVDSSGRLLIGHTSSQQSTSMLQVSRANNSTIRVASSDSTATNYAALDLAPANSIAGASIAAVAVGTFGSTGAETAYLKFSTRNAGTTSEKLRIRQDGKISAGTSINVTNSYEFSVTGADGTGAFYAHGRNHYLSNRSNAYASLTLKKANADSDATDYLQLRDSSNAYLSGFTGAGNLKPAAGKGIDFSSTGDASAMDSEILDDYEEGAWTPTARNDGSFTSATGRYVKIGQEVTVYGFIPTVTNNTSNNILQCSGLPYTVTSGGHTEFVGPLMIRFLNATGLTGASFNVYTASGRDYIEFFACRDDDNNYEAVKHSDLAYTNSNGIRFSISYTV